jgi:hypothetical protein
MGNGAATMATRTRILYLYVLLVVVPGMKIADHLARCAN